MTCNRDLGILAQRFAFSSRRCSWGTDSAQRVGAEPQSWKSLGTNWPRELEADPGVFPARATKRRLQDLVTLGQCWARAARGCLLRHDMSSRTESWNRRYTPRLSGVTGWESVRFAPNFAQTGRIIALLRTGEPELLHSEFGRLRVALPKSLAGIVAKSCSDRRSPCTADRSRHRHR
jgi:hypothetical protein